MQNEVIELMKQINDNAMSTAKRIGEFNMKTLETFSAKQAAVVNDCVNASTKNAEAMFAAKDVNEVVELQKAALAQCSEKWSANLRESVEMANTIRDEWTAIFEEAQTQTKENSEKAAELSKKVVAEGAEKVTEAVEKAAAQAVEAANEVAAMNKEATEKAVAATQEAAEKAVEANKKAMSQVA